MIPQIDQIPILFLSGLKDEIVPPDHMRKLYSICRAPVKIWKDFPEGTHNDTVAEPGYFYAIDDISHHCVIKSGQVTK